MADLNQYPAKYLELNSQLSKDLVVVMEIEGVPNVFSSSASFTVARYGDPGLYYGLEGLVYGGLKPGFTYQGANGPELMEFSKFLVLDAGLTIGQRIEPEQGKGNVGTISITLVDYQGQVSRIIAPGIVVDEIIAKREVKLWLGFRQSSWPQDYLLIYRGYVTSTACPPGAVQFQISDSISKKRQPVFSAPQAILLAPLAATGTNVILSSSQGFFQQIQDIRGQYDSDVRTFIRIDDEIMEYAATASLGGGSLLVTRGQIGTVAAPHDLGASISNTVLLGHFATGMNSIDLAKKVMLSGWDGPCESNIQLSGVGVEFPSGFPNVNALELGTDAHGNPYDAVKILGLSVGDQVQVTGVPASGDFIISAIEDGLSENSRLIVENGTFTPPYVGDAASANFRSQWDTLPILCGLSMRMRDVDLPTMQYIQDNYFSAAGVSNMRFYRDAPEDGKEFIDKQIMLPLGCYSISRFGKISMGIAKPPLPGVGNLVQLDWTNVIKPENIRITRATNQRSFYNLIRYQYNKLIVSGDYTSIDQSVDFNAGERFNQTSVLPITADGITDTIGGTLPSLRGNALLSRYQNCALILELSVNWTIGCQIEVADIVLVVDDGHLKIMNFETGERNLKSQLFEVIDRSFNLASGEVKLKLLSGLGFDLSSRFGLISPSSFLDPALTTATSVRVVPSFGQVTLTAELAKWSPRFFGLQVRIHSEDFTFDQVTRLIGPSLTDPLGFEVFPALVGPLPMGLLMDIGDYSVPGETIYKTLYAHLSPTVPVTSGSSNTVFEVGPGDISKFFVGAILIVHSEDYVRNSPEVQVTDITGNQITVGSSLGFTPNSSDFVDGIGFSFDETSFYRYT